VERERRRGHPKLRSHRSRGHSRRAFLYQESVDAEARILREGSECSDNLFSLHIRYFYHYRSIGAIIIWVRLEETGGAVNASTNGFIGEARLLCVGTLAILETAELKEVRQKIFGMD